MNVNSNKTTTEKETKSSISLNARLMLSKDGLKNLETAIIRNIFHGYIQFD